MRALRQSIALSAILLVVAVVGCGGYDYGPTGSITGRLTMDGKPLPAGHAVTFMEMQKGYLAFGVTNENGDFEVKSWNEGNMPLGPYKVAIAPPAGTAPDTSKYSADELFEHPELMEERGGEALFPRRYLATSTSGLEYTVKEGENHFDIDLKGGKQPAAQAP
jgi:hypothetical protein